MNLIYVKTGYSRLITYLVPLCVVPFIGIIIIMKQASHMKQEDMDQVWLHLQCNLVRVIICCTTIVFGITFYIMRRSRPVYLVDFACYKPPPHLKVPFSKFMLHSTLNGYFNGSSLGFQRKILERSGLGEETHLPQALHSIPSNPSIAAAREEVEQVMFGALDDLFANTNVKPKDIKIVFVNCSLFNPTPSLTAMIVNRYKKGYDVRTYNLGGMGCSAGITAIDLAKDLLQLHGNTYAVVVSTENITQNCYFGNNRAMLIPNCLFRLGGAAILLSNKFSERRRAKYELVHVVRTHNGADDKSFKCVHQVQDAVGKLGVCLSRDLMEVAGEALKANITALGPFVLPMREKLLFLCSFLAKKLFGSEKKAYYVPNFNVVFDHFCIHAGSKAVIGEVERNLKLLPSDVEASRMALHRSGNTSSSSIWYELAYIEAKGKMKRGNRVWQIAFGSGFKCNSAVWKALTHVKPSPNTPWEDCIHRYPVAA
uniref:3-ketoacyl-CoA synthase n=2 Tax=Cajanus cajan TaxID=3821 RepID=A0A151TGA2_CAJCA|nr:3-ketoacyl-CoA synthase 4 [Cajanus cajan]